MEQQARETKLQIHKSGHQDVTLLRLVGTIEEAFDGAALAKGLTRQLVISLAEIRRITSFGIRQWIRFLTLAGETCDQIYFIECAPRVVDQFNMVAGFGGKGHLVSFYAPFRCDQCGTESLKLVQVDRDWTQIRAKEIEADACPNDGTAVVLDDDPSVFLSYVASQSPFEVDSKVAEFLASRTQFALSERMRGSRIEKQIRDRYTFISVNGDMGEDLPIEKIAEGLEGDVVFNLAGVGRMDDAGRLRWQKLLATVASSTERILVVGLPPSMIEQMDRGNDLAGKGQVLSLYLPYSCRSCQTTSHLEVDVAMHQRDLQFAAPPSATCPDCRQPVECMASEAMLSGLTQLPVPAKDLDVKQLLQWAHERLPSAEAPSRTPSRHQPQAGKPWLTLVGIGLLAALGVGLGIYLVATRDVDRGRGSANIEKQAKLIEASHPRAPSWQGQSFVVEGGRVLLVGSSELTPDKETGFEMARAAALETLSHHVGNSIRNPVWVEHVAGQYQSFRSKALSDLEQALVTGDQEQLERSRKRVLAGRKDVATALEGGPIGHPQRSTYYWRKLATPVGNRYRVWSLYEMDKQEFRRLVEHYSRVEEALSVVVVSYFPGLAWRYGTVVGAVVIGLKPDSPLRYVGVLAGDIVVSAQDRAIKDATSFRRVLTQEYTDLQAEGGTMMLRVKRGDGPIVLHRLHVPKKKTDSPVSKRPVSKGTKAGGKMPPANIWDDNPFQ